MILVNISGVPVLWSTSVAAVDRDTRLQSIVPPGVLVDDGHYGQKFEVLRGKEQQNKRDINEVCCLPNVSASTLLSWLSLTDMSSLETTDEDDGKVAQKRLSCCAVWWTTGGGWGLHTLCPPPTEKQSGFFLCATSTRTGTYPCIWSTCSLSLIISHLHHHNPYLPDPCHIADSCGSMFIKVFLVILKSLLRRKSQTWYF